MQTVHSINITSINQSINHRGPLTQKVTIIIVNIVYCEMKLRYYTSFCAQSCCLTFSMISVCWVVTWTHFVTIYRRTMLIWQKQCWLLRCNYVWINSLFCCWCSCWLLSVNGVAIYWAILSVHMVIGHIIHIHSIIPLGFYGHWSPSHCDRRGVGYSNRTYVRRSVCNKFAGD